MERLWAPWRMAFLETPQRRGCVFCETPPEERDRENLILYRGRTCFVIMNLFPYNNGHLMVTPYRHTADITGLTPHEAAELFSLTQECVRLLKGVYQPDAFNLGMNLGRSAGAGIADHLHMHIVPRWHGDTNFMPVLSETRVLPDALFSSYDRLAEALSALGDFGTSAAEA